jgi:uncharacterized protein (TIGR04141 family)
MSQPAMAGVRHRHENVTDRPQASLPFQDVSSPEVVARLFGNGLTCVDCCYRHTIRAMTVPNQTLAVYAAKTDTSVRSFIKAGLRPRALGDGSGLTGALYIQAPPAKPPKWLAFVQPALATRLERVHTRSASAVLVLNVDDRTLAVTFGHGRHLLRRENIDLDFGLRVVLNAVAPDKLRSVDVRTLEDDPLHTRRQAARASDLEIFGVDVTRDVLRAVTGEPRDRTLALRLTGADSLTFTAPIRIGDLLEKLRMFIALREEDIYKERFSWIDHMAAERDSTTIRALDGILEDTLSAYDPSVINLAPPEPVDWAQIEGFRFPSELPTDPLHPDLDVADYLASRNGGGLPKTVDLKRDHIGVQRPGVSHPVSEWSVYEALVFETEFANATYVLSAGQWFRVDHDWATRVRASTTALAGATNLVLLPHIHGEREEVYNARVRDADAATFVLMDQKFVRASDTSTPIEVCDLLTTNREMIHVKRGTRSSTLSHVFMQGTVSGETFLSDEGFRRQMREHITASRPDLVGFAPDQRPDARQYSIVYAIIVPRPGAITTSLPFFSQVALMQAAERMRTFGFRVGVVAVPTA